MMVIFCSKQIKSLYFEHLQSQLIFTVNTSEQWYINGNKSREVRSFKENFQGTFSFQTFQSLTFNSNTENQMHKSTDSYPECLIVTF